MRHYERADLRHLNDSERYRDYDYLADDGWPPAAEPLSMREPPASAPELAVPAPPSTWQLLLTALLNPRRTIRKALGRAPV
jgi:hypothetical protein